MCRQKLLQKMDSIPFVSERASCKNWPAFLLLLVKFLKQLASIPLVSDNAFICVAAFPLFSAELSVKKWQAFLLFLEKFSWKNWLAFPLCLVRFSWKFGKHSCCFGQCGQFCGKHSSCFLGSLPAKNGQHSSFCWLSLSTKLASIPPMFSFFWPAFLLLLVRLPPKIGQHSSCYG